MAGDDRLFGDAGDDTSIGGYGNEYLHAGGGSIILYGGAGDDVLDALWASTRASEQNGEEVAGWVEAKCRA